MDESIIVTIYFITFALLVLLGFYFLMKLNSNLSEKGEKERMKVISWGPHLRKEYFNETGQKYRNYVHYIAILMFIVFFLFIIILIISLQLKKIAP